MAYVNDRNSDPHEVMTSVSRSCVQELTLTLRSAYPGTYFFEMETQSTYFPPLRESEFVYFEVGEAYILGATLAGCSSRLFDYAYMPDESLFGESTGAVRMMKLGVEAEDEAGRITVHLDRWMRLQAVPSSRWSRYFPIFDGPYRSLPQESIEDFENGLRVFSLGISEIVGGVRRGVRINKFTTLSGSLQPDSGMCFWQSPVAATVRRVRFDVRRLRGASNEQLEFMIVPFFPVGSLAYTQVWHSAEDLAAVGELNSPAFPGHGFTLAWRSRGR